MKADDRVMIIGTTKSPFGNVDTVLQDGITLQYRC